MSERKLGSVTYREVGRGLLRQAGSAATCRRDVPLGARRRGRHLRRVLRLELRPRTPVDSAACLVRRRDHGDHVLRPRVLDRRDVARPPSHGRGLLLRAIGDGSMGRVPHGSRREHGVRHHARGGRGCDGPADAADRGRSVRGRRHIRGRRIDHRHRLVEQPPVLVGRLLRDLRRYQHHRHRSHDEVHRRHHGPLPRRAGVLLHRRPRVREVRPGLLDEPPDGRRRRRRLHSRVAAGRCSRSGSAASSRLSRSRSGSSWRSKRSPWPRRSRWTRGGTSLEARCSRCTRS